MNPRSSASNLAQALKDLSVEWDQAKNSWRDVKAQEFGAGYIDCLPQQIARATAAIEELDGVLRKVRNACE